ncbi:flagellar protein FlaG [bacterium]|nr:flagellar protein FlaG [bacterium]
MSGVQGIHPIDEVKDSILIGESAASSNIAPEREISSQSREVQNNVENAVALDEHTAQEIADGMNKVSSVFNTSLSFSVDKSTGRTIIKVVDKDTEKVIREIPPEKMVRLMEKISNVMGLLLDVEI